MCYYFRWFEICLVFYLKLKPYGESSLRTSSWYASALFFKFIPYNRKIVSIGVLNSRFFLIYFLRTPSHELAFYSLNYSLYLFPSLTQPCACIFQPNYFMLLFILCILYYLKNLQAKITTYAYYRTHFTQQSKSFYNSKRRLLFS